MKGKRAQAAMEFLMTYGWALIVVLIAIGALAFFGVLTPGQFQPETCLLGPGFACEDHKVQEVIESGVSINTIQINVRNGLGTSLDTFLVYVADSAKVCRGYTGYITIPLPAPFTKPPFKDGEAKQIIVLSQVLLPPNEKGIACFDDGLKLNCCNHGIYSAAIGEPICNIPISPGCEVVASLPKGSKFNEEIVIIYREGGSSILHKRIGQISAQVE